MDKQTVECAYNGVLFRSKKKKNIDIENTMEKISK